MHTQAGVSQCGRVIAVVVMACAVGRLAVSRPARDDGLSPSPTRCFRRSREVPLQRSDSVLDLRGKPAIVIAVESQRGTERHARASGPRHVPPVMKDAIDSFDPHRDDRYLETRGDHADARLEGIDRAGLRTASFREDQHGGAFAQQLA